MEVTRSQPQFEGEMYKCLTFSVPTVEINDASKHQQGRKIFIAKCKFLFPYSIHSKQNISNNINDI